MAVIKRADAEEYARAAVALHLGDLHRAGDELVAEARQRADAVIAEAEAERERLIGTASAEGHARGLAEGLEEGRARGREEGHAEALKASAVTISELESAWTAALTAFEDERARMIAEAKRDILKLAAVFAERIVKRAVALDPSVVERQLESVIDAAVRPSRLVIAVHPDDLEAARGTLPALADRLDEAAHTELTPDASLRRGSCVARLAGGAVIDASIDTQIDRMVDALLPGGRPGGSRGEEPPA